MGAAVVAVGVVEAEEDFAMALIAHDRVFRAESRSSERAELRGMPAPTPGEPTRARRIT